MLLYNHCTQSSIVLLHSLHWLNLWFSYSHCIYAMTAFVQSIRLHTFCIHATRLRASFVIRRTALTYSEFPLPSQREKKKTEVPRTPHTYFCFQWVTFLTYIDFYQPRPGVPDLAYHVIRTGWKRLNPINSLTYNNTKTNISTLIFYSRFFLYLRLLKSNSTNKYVFIRYFESVLEQIKDDEKKVLSELKGYFTYNLREG